ncbi:MAG: DUF5674 family protein [Planctomycetota bacterium]
MCASRIPRILVVSSRIEPAELAQLVVGRFEGTVRFVVDVDRGLAALGGEQHAAAEDLLLERGSRHDSLWGGYYVPGREPDACIEHASPINIRPARGNRTMLIEDESVRSRVRAIVFKLIGTGEPLS